MGNELAAINYAARGGCNLMPSTKCRLHSICSTPAVPPSTASPTLPTLSLPPLCLLSSLSLSFFCSLSGSLTLPFLSVCKNNASCGYCELATEVALCLQLAQPCELSHCKHYTRLCRQCQASQSPTGMGGNNSNAFLNIRVIATTTAKPNSCSIGDCKIFFNLFNSPKSTQIYLSCCENYIIFVILRINYAFNSLLIPFLL